MKRRGLVGNSTFALAADVAGKGGALALAVVAARLLPVGQFALWAAALASASLLAALLDGGAQTLLTREGAADANVRGSLLRALTLGRAPLALAALALAPLVGLAFGHALEGFAVCLLAVVAAAGFTVTGVLRSAQDLRPEASFKLTGALLALAAGIVCLTFSRRADLLLLSSAAANLVVLWPLVRRSRRLAAFVPGTRPLLALRRALPLGLMAVATLVFYRAGTLALQLGSTAQETASFTIAANVGFGLLALPNAITTGLLPRLADETDPHLRTAVARRALGWTAALCAPLCVAAALTGPFLLPLLFGARYHTAAVPLALLAAGVFLIALNGVIGTGLIAAGRLRLLALQVAVSLVVNLACLALLVGRHGAAGAALATVVCETVATGVLVFAAYKHLPGLLPAVPGGQTALGLLRRLPKPRPNLLLRTGVLVGLAALGELAVVSRAHNYALRVTSDSPTFLSLIPQMAMHPFRSESAYLAHGQVASSHVTPYTQLLAFAWRIFAPGGALTGQPVALGRMLALVGIVVYAVLLACVFQFVRAHSSVRAAWLSVPVLLLLFGPANVIWASDLSLHGLLYAGYFPQNVALCLLLGALLTLERRTGRSLAAACLLTGLTMIVHPFTGVLLCLLVTGQAVWQAATGRPWLRGPVALGVGFVAGVLCWPAFSLARAFSDSGLPAWPFLACCMLAPLAAAKLPRRRLPQRLAEPVRSSAAWLAGRRAELLLALLGFVGVALLSYWEWSLLSGPTDNPLSRNHHLAVYWVEDRWRWPLLFAAGSVGVAGLARLAQRGRPLPALWAAGCFALGLAGMAGLPVPVWWRFLLFAQVPLALGAALVAAETRSRIVRTLLVGAFALSLVVKCYSLLGTSPRVSYYNSELQGVWSLGPVLPAGRGLVASDPFTSYYLPAVSGRPVLTVTKAHVGSPGELRSSESGYQLLHRFATWESYSGYNWWQDARGLWREGVRYVVVEHSTSLRPETLRLFSTGPTPLVRTDNDRAVLGRYMWRLNRIGHIVSDDDSYAVWRLDGTVINGRPASPSSLPLAARLVPNPPGQ